MPRGKRLKGFRRALRAKFYGTFALRRGKTVVISENTNGTVLSHTQGALQRRMIAIEDGTLAKVTGRMKWALIGVEILAGSENIGLEAFVNPQVLMVL